LPTNLNPAGFLYVAIPAIGEHDRIPTTCVLACTTRPRKDRLPHVGDNNEKSPSE